jgi:hypothetical protein
MTEGFRVLSAALEGGPATGLAGGSSERAGSAVPCQNDWSMNAWIVVRGWGALRG